MTHWRRKVVRRTKASSHMTVIAGDGPVAPVCYASLGKMFSRELLSQVAIGNGWALQTRAAHDPRRLAVFYGVTLDTLDTFRAAQRDGHWLYIDHAYFGRGRFYRVTYDALQHHGRGDSDGRRWRALGLEIAPWRRGGRHILVCPQSDGWHRWLMDGGTPEAWAERVCAELRRYTDRPIVVRHKPTIARERMADAVEEASRQLMEALEDCHAVVVHQSGVGIQAALAGVPVFALGPGAVGPMACNDLSRIERPFRPDDRLRWASVLADNQWTLEELRAGVLRKIYGPR